MRITNGNYIGSLINTPNAPYTDPSQLPADQPSDPWSGPPISSDPNNPTPVPTWTPPSNGLPPGATTNAASSTDTPGTQPGDEPNPVPDSPPSTPPPPDNTPPADKTPPPPPKYGKTPGTFTGPQYFTAYDEGKFNDPNYMKSPKYQVLRTLSNFDPTKGITPEVLSALNSLGLGAFALKPGSKDYVTLNGADPAWDGMSGADLIANEGPQGKWGIQGTFPGDTSGGGTGDTTSSANPNANLEDYIKGLQPGNPNATGSDALKSLLQRYYGAAGPNFNFGTTLHH